MKLSELTLFEELTIIRNYEFIALAKCTDINIPNGVLTYLENERYLKSVLTNNRISCVITSPNLAPSISRDDIGIAVCDNPKYVFFSIHNYIARLNRHQSQNLVIGENCSISNTAKLLANSIEIGNNVIIEDYVIIKGNVVIHDNSIIRAGAIIGSSSYENCRSEQGTLLEVDEVGTIIIDSGVEIGEYAIIDNAIFSWDHTYIGKNAFIGPRSIIGHGCRISDNVTIKHGCIICGFVTIGSGTIISPGALINNRLCLSENSIVSLGAVVSKNTEPYKRVTGNLAVEHRRLLRLLKYLEKLEDE